MRVRTHATRSQSPQDRAERADLRALRSLERDGEEPLEPLQECGRRGAKACPVAGCDAKYGRRHALYRDTALSAKLAEVSADVTTVWLCGSEVRTMKPGNREKPSAEAAGVAETKGFKRARSRSDEASGSTSACARYETRRGCGGVIALD